MCKPNVLMSALSKVKMSAFSIKRERYNQIQGAPRLGLSTHQLRRMQARFRIEGTKGIISKHSGKTKGQRCF